MAGVHFSRVICGTLPLEMDPDLPYKAYNMDIRYKVDVIGG